MSFSGKRLQDIMKYTLCSPSALNNRHWIYICTRLWIRWHCIEPSLDIKLIHNILILKVVRPLEYTVQEISKLKQVSFASTFTFKVIKQFLHRWVILVEASFNYEFFQFPGHHLAVISVFLKSFVVKYTIPQERLKH